MLRRRLQQLSFVVNGVTFSLLGSLLLAHILLRRYLPNVAHGKENFDFFFEGDQEGDDQHHPAFVIDWKLLLGTLLAFLVSCAVDVGGLAGGGLLVPIFYQVVGFGLKASTGLSQAAIAGASAAALAANLFRAQISFPSNSSSSGGNSRSHTSTDHAGTAVSTPDQEWLQDSSHAEQQPLVDLDLVLLLTPGLLLGVAVGAVMNDLLPEWFISAALVAVLLLSCYKTAVRGLLTWHAEEQAEASLAAAAAISSGPQPRLRPIHTGTGGCASAVAAGGSSRGSSPRCAFPLASSAGSSERSCSSSSSKHQLGAAAAATAVAAADAEDSVDVLPGQSNSSSAGTAVSAALGTSVPAAATDRVPSPAMSDSDSSSSLGCVQLQRRPSTPIYECKTTNLTATHPDSSYWGGSAAVGGRPSSRLARTGLYPGWFSPPESEAGGTAAAAGAGGGPAAAWYPVSRSSSATGIAYVITDDRLPAWRQQQHGSNTAAAAAAAAAAMQHLQQLWLWLPPVHLEHVPWMKLLSLLALWLGFMGLTALSGLLPFCTWSYVTYLLLFTGITGCITAMLIQVLLVEPLLGARQVCLLSEKLQQFVHKHSRYSGDLEGQQQQHSPLHQPLLQHDYGQFQQQQQYVLPVQAGMSAVQQQQHMVPPCSHAAAASAAAPTAAESIRASLGRASRSAWTWLHVLTGFGRAPAVPLQDQQQQQQQQSVAAVEAQHAAQHRSNAGCQQQQQQTAEWCAEGHQEQQQQEPQRKNVEKLSLFTQMRLQQQQQRQQQQHPWGNFQPPVLPPMGPVEAATDSYFFPCSAAADSSSIAASQLRPPPKRFLAPLATAAAAAAAGAEPASARQGIGAVWAGFKRVLQGQTAPDAQSPQLLDPFDGNEQPWRYEEPFPVAAASPGPAPSLAAAAAAAAAGDSNGSSALVTIAAAAAVVSVAAGVLTAVTGVASSALFMPILLDFRVHTQVAMASTVVLVFLSSSAASLSFILQGRLIGSYALLFCVVGLCGGCVGVSMVGALLRLARRPSVVVLVLSGALAVAGLSCSITGVWGFMEGWEMGRLGFRALCQQ